MPSKPKTFRSAVELSQGDVEREYEWRRGSARERGYTAGWDRSSALFRHLHPLCLGCEAVGLFTVTTVTDHTEPHKGDPVKFWDRNNWQPSCDWHHDRVKQLLERLFVTGAITVTALRLDSPQAIALTRDLMSQGEAPR